MDNLKTPAYPQPLTIGSDGTVLTPLEKDSDFAGFTKLERASLMIAQGLVSDPANTLTDTLAKLSVAFAKTVLEQANK